ncbi:MAG: alpha/beta hydrolase [Dehalococcoidia bacterium]|nr:alpha/beta hydrolase [Dehalococcoidia bacterium]
MPPHGPYLLVNGLRTYYEVHGRGTPVLLLHGGLDTIEPFRAAFLPALARAHRVVLPERRGHGRTADLPGPITYDLMMADTIAFMEALLPELRRCDIVGWSDGAIIAMLVAIRRPELVNRLVLISANYEPEGLRAELRAAIPGWTADTFSDRMPAAYRRLSPDGPEHLPIVLEKMKRLFLQEPRLTLADLDRIVAPTLVMAGDDDLVESDHTLRLSRALRQARLAIVPGGSHELPLDQPEAVTALILDFLDG